MTKKSVLRVDIGVALKVVAGPTLKAFSGTGVKRRREEWATREVADHVAQRVSNMHKFFAGDVRVDQKEVAALIFETLIALPDDVVKALTDKRVDDAQWAKELITESLEAALTSIWLHKHEPDGWDGGFTKMQK